MPYASGLDEAYEETFVLRGCNKMFMGGGPPAEE